MAAAFSSVPSVVMPAAAARRIMACASRYKPKEGGIVGVFKNLLEIPAICRTITIEGARQMPTKDTSTRTSRLEARVAPETLALVKRAAEIQGRSVSDFVVAAAQEAAKRAIEDAQMIRFSLEGQEAFFEAITNMRPVPDGFRKAVRRHRELIRDVR